jgi:hypothetical protein
LSIFRIINRGNVSENVKTPFSQVIVCLRNRIMVQLTYDFLAINVLSGNVLVPFLVGPYCSTLPFLLNIPTEYGAV